MARPPREALDAPPAPATPDIEDEAVEGGTEPEVRTAVVDEGTHGQRLDKLLVGLAGEFSRSHLQTLIEDGCVQVDGRLVTTASRKVAFGQRVTVELRPTPESQAFRPEPVPLAIVYEDEHLMVLHKPAGRVVHPAAGNWSGTLLNGLLAHHRGAAQLPRAGIVHRLDKDTSGLMVVGKTLPAVTQLVRLIAAREVRREYLAITHGEIREPQRLASIEAPIGRDPQSRVRMAVVAGGKPARTDVTLVAARDDFSAVRCKLHTGRTHQIRVHLASRGFPLVADAVYGGRPALGMERQALHATRLGFEHPCTGEPLVFEAPAPADFAQAWLQLAGDAV
ncbi:RluA family pseudouridine synthase [Caldimonas tepidiphila]|uniref:RluA family pseudouridine synthase n=1 Tax=Caldimonas tepidiphila TaxID=2315841 RepID=UPI000E5AB719|nr:RluA family pseudouridine synthase [Caldimonas tepidiphila]